MITKFETYDKNEPDVGDYITDSIKTYRIGKIYMKNDKNWSVSYIIPLDNNLCYLVPFDKVTHWSKNKEDLEPYILANKYNVG